MDGIQIVVSGIGIMVVVISLIVLNMMFEQKRHNKSVETQFTEIRDRLKPSE